MIGCYVWKMSLKVAAKLAYDDMVVACFPSITKRPPPRPSMPDRFTCTCSVVYTMTSHPRRSQASSVSPLYTRPRQALPALLPLSFQLVLWASLQALGDQPGVSPRGPRQGSFVERWVGGKLVGWC